MDWLSCAKNFVNIVELGSFSAAARKRYTSPSALSKQISWLEDDLGSKLFQRTTRKLHLTHEGEVYYQRVKQIITNITDAKTVVQTSQNELVGSLTLSMPTAYGKSKLMDWVCDFIKLHPKLDVYILFANQLVDLVESGVDIAYRNKPVDRDDFCSIRVIDLQCRVYASPDYLRKFGAPKIPSDLAHHNCLGYNDGCTREWTFAKDTVISPSGNFSCNSITALKQAALAGLGLIYMVERHVKEYVDAGQLVSVLDDHLWTPIPMYLNYIKQQYAPRRVQAFVDFVMDRVNKQRAQSTT